MRFLIQGFLLVGKANTLPSSRQRGNISLYFNQSTALNHGKFINTCEPAAVLVFLQRIRVVEFMVPEFAAAGHFEVKCKNKAKQKKEDKK
jgi:hypothetical protein